MGYYRAGSMLLSLNIHVHSFARDMQVYKAGGKVVYYWSQKISHLPNQTA